ncbi:ATP-binding cassette domain-containing protein [Streptomyces sp. WMMC1477]|uniref:ATP-binding cassette domain-containing protein n=1 Tax=Streptomyces sp. WMMC1477 TaxID=3015155 RepID=UPI0022B69083|nr:ABC transporter ATP-binding protein [Streptomyces sp. WMMC1477]MCZ7433633.1 ABC transporter ATP-binding protein [Streptomyces sp. WMMC1477]
MSRPPRPGRGALRRLLPQARRFLRHRTRVLVRLALLSLLESGGTFLSGYALARALDDGFLAGHPGVGLLWLGAGALAVLVSGPVVRAVFGALAELTEPLRDGLVRRAVTRALHRATADPARAGGGSAAGADSAVVSRLTQQTEIARDSFAGLVLTTRSFVFTALGALVGLASLAPQFLLVVLPPLAAGLLLFLCTLTPMAAAQRRFLDRDEAFADRAGALRGGLRDIAACGSRQQAEAEAAPLVEAAASSARALARWAAARTVALGVAGQLPVALLLVATPWLLRQGVTPGALLGAFAYLVQALLPALRTLMTAVGAAGTRLLVVLDRLAGTPPPARPRPDAAPAPGPPGPGRRAPAVECRGVTVSYGPGSRPVVDGLDLVVEEGEHLAVLGPSGIGKSTLTHVLSGLMTPDRGSVRLAGQPVAGRTRAELARLRAVLPQQAYVFTGSLQDNLRLLRPDAHSADVRAAAEALLPDELLRRLGGLDGAVRPGTLSEGERQLICLARAHLAQAPLLILDEATCHLDPGAEAHAERFLARRSGTLLVVAHRLSSARRAHRVLLLDDTEAVCGTHGHLLRSSPAYRRLLGHAEPGAAGPAAVSALPVPPGGR